MQTADDVMVQAYLWMATASSLAAAAWVARRKLFGEGVPLRGATGDEPRRSPVSASRRLSDNWDDDESSLLENLDDANSFASDSFYQPSPVDEGRRSRTPPSSRPRRIPGTPSSSVHFAEHVEFSPAAESILTDRRASSETESVESVLMKVVEHLDQTAAPALEIFFKYDSDGSGTLSVAQLTSVLAELGLRIYQDDVRNLAKHIGVLSAGSVLDGEVLAIKGFLRALKQARNARRAEEEKAMAPAPEAAAAAPAPAPSTSETATKKDSPKSMGKIEENKEPTDEAVDGVQTTEEHLQQPDTESKKSIGLTERAERTAWAAATSRDGKPARPQSASRARPRTQEAELANTRRALDHYDTGCEHLDDGNWTAAEAELRRALTLQPNFPDCQRRLAALKRKQGEDAALNTRQSTLGFTPQIERKPHAIARGRVATPHGVNEPTISSSRKAVGTLVATGRVVPASAPAARRRRPTSPQTQGLEIEPPSTELGYRMEQLKEERGKEEVVQRLYDWELSKKARIEEAQQAAAPAFTPQPYASTRRREYDHVEFDESETGADLVDRCFEWSQNREEWLKAKQDEQLRNFQLIKRAADEDSNGTGPAAFPTPKRYQRKADAWGSLDFVSRMAEADREKNEKLEKVRREKLAARQAEEEKHMVHVRKVVATKQEGEEIAERLFRWEADKQNVLNDVRQEIQAAQQVNPKPRLDAASRSMIDTFDTNVPVTDRLLHWHEVHNEQLEQKRVQTLAEDEAELTFKPKLGKTAQKVRSNRPLSKENVFETLHDTAGSRTFNAEANDSAKATVAREKARIELRSELEGLTVPLLKKRAAAVGVSVHAFLDAIKTAEDARMPRHAARGEHGWRGSIEHVAEEKSAVIESILNAAQVPHSTSFNKNARVGRGGFLSGRARNEPISSSNSRKTISNGKSGQERAASTGPTPRVASLSPTRGRRGRSASTDRRKSPQQLRRIKTPSDKHASERVHFMRFNSAEKRREIHGGPEICDDGRPLSLPGTPTRTSPGLAAHRAAGETEGSRHQSSRPSTIGSRLNMNTHTQAQVLRLTEEEKREREVENVFRVIRQELDAHRDRTLYGRKLGDARRTFGLMDRDGNGFLSREEFAQGLKRLDFGLTDEQLAEVLDVVDTDGNGTVEYDEFLARLQQGANEGEVSCLHLEGSAASSPRAGKEGTLKMDAKDTKKYFDERHAEAQLKKQARRQEISAKKAASGASGRLKPTTRPKGAANPLLSVKPNERLSKLSKPRTQPATQDATGVCTRKEPLSPGHVPRTAAPRHRVRRQSPRRSSDHHGREAALAVFPDRNERVHSSNDQPQRDGPDRDRAAALQAAHNALRMSGLASTDNGSGKRGVDGARLAENSDSVGGIGLLDERSQSGQQASGWTLDSFH